KSGQIKTSKDEIERIIDEAGSQFPFMGKIRWFREIDKALSTYLRPLYLQSDPADDTARINFRQDGTDTGRYATPSRGDGDDFMVGWPHVNVHSIPKASDSNEHPECLNRVRECISCRPPEPGKPPKYMAAIDFSGEELRIITNLSREPKWLKEFFHCSGCDRMFDAGDGPNPVTPPARCPNCGSDKIGDIHTLTGLSVYGQDANTKPNWKELRGAAKGLNFALCYGGGGAAAQRATGVDKNEGWRLKNTFDRSYTGLKSWWDSQHDFARKHGFVRTAFGRKYPVPDINSPDGGFRSKAERNAVNGPIQGCISSDSRIPTSTGIFTVKELWDRQQIGQQEFQVWTGKKWSSARVLFSGEKNLSFTSLNNGSVIKTSPDHRFRVYDEGVLKWVRQEDLKIGACVVVNAKALDFLKDPVYHYDPVRTPQKGHLFDYDYEKVTELTNSGTKVPMYDIEVFDDDHAFVCNGAVVHNSGSDICKIAMTLVYREMKNRGWLEKVMMVMTMHDELVFEIDADILEEVLPILVNIMAQNQVVLGMKWPVPLTCDVEIGHDWTVPWHMTEMKFGEIRFIGNKKYKTPKKIPEGMDWKLMQRYPDELKPWLSEARGEKAPIPPTPPVSPPPSDPPPSQDTISVPSESPVSPIVILKDPPLPRADSISTGSPPAGIPQDVPKDVAAAINGGVFTYQLKVPLTLGVVIRLSDVIHQCQNRGMALLKLVSRTGESLDEWSKGQEIRVSPTTFYVLAQHYGI
ncbi:MAG: DNA polymerase, partial [Bacteroidota bacterium]